MIVRAMTRPAPHCHLESSAILPARQATVTLAIKVACWGFQMWLSIFSGLSKVCQKDHHKVVTSHHEGHHGHFKVITWVITRHSPMVVSAITRPALHHTVIRGHHSYHPCDQQVSIMGYLPHFHFHCGQQPL